MAVVIEVHASSKTEETVRLMAETLPYFGYGAIEADCDGFRRPEEVKGILRNYKPSLLAMGAKPLIMDVVLFDAMVHPTELVLRWQLFESAAEAMEGHLDIVVPSLVLFEGDDKTKRELTGKDFVKRIAKDFKIKVDRIWEI